LKLFKTNTELSGNELVRLTGFAFGRDCNHGSALLKLNTIEDKLLNKYFKLIEILRDQQKGVKHVISNNKNHYRKMVLSGENLNLAKQSQIIVI
jgi:hypothetical protein